MVERDLGTATIVYDDPESGTVERTVQNEHLVYVRDHWSVKLDEDGDGNDVLRRIPRQRVHYVERSVEEFEREVETLQQRVQSVADDLRTKLLGDDEPDESVEPHRIDVERAEDREGT